MKCNTLFTCFILLIAFTACSPEEEIVPIQDQAEAETNRINPAFIFDLPDTILSNMMYQEIRESMDPRASVPVPSRWYGTATINTGGKRVRLPMLIDIKKPVKRESNPVNLFVVIGREGSYGNTMLFSAVSFNHNGRNHTEQYFKVKKGSSYVKGQLTNTGNATALNLNQFYGPNPVDAMPYYLRNIMGGVYGSIPNNNIYPYKPGATVYLNTKTGKGSIKGYGAAPIGFIFPISPVAYQASFTLKRID